MATSGISAFSEQSQLFTNIRNTASQTKSHQSFNSPGRITTSPASTSHFNTLDAASKVFDTTQATQQHVNNSLLVAMEGLIQIGSYLQGFRDTATSASNSLISNSGRSALMQEGKTYTSAIAQTAESTSYRGTKLLDGSFERKDFKTDNSRLQTADIEHFELHENSSNTYDTRTFAANSRNDKTFRLSISGFTAKDLGIENISLASASSAKEAATTLDKALNKVNKGLADIAQIQKRFDSHLAKAERTRLRTQETRLYSPGINFAAGETNLRALQVKSNAPIATSFYATGNSPFTKGKLSLKL